MDYNKFDSILSNTLQELKNSEISKERASAMAELAEVALEAIRLQAKYENGDFDNIDFFEPFFLSDVYLTDDLETMKYRFLHTQQLIDKIRKEIEKK